MIHSCLVCVYDCWCLIYHLTVCWNPFSASLVADMMGCVTLHTKNGTTSCCLLMLVINTHLYPHTGIASSVAVLHCGPCPCWNVYMCVGRKPWWADMCCCTTVDHDFVLWCCQRKLWCILGLLVLLPSVLVTACLVTVVPAGIVAIVWVIQVCRVVMLVLICCVRQVVDRCFAVFGHVTWLAASVAYCH